MNKVLLLAAFAVAGFVSAKNDFSDRQIIKEKIVKSENFQKFLVEEWYWFTLSGNTLAFITESEAEAFDQAFEYYMTSSNCARQRGEFVPSYV